jgi:adenylate cyclase
MVTRQLSAIMFADIQGYTALMQENEEKARTIQVKFQRTLRTACKDHNGHIVEIKGDGALCIFSSDIEAVRAAIVIQNEMVPEPKVPLRIGVHSGDILFDGNDVYGNGVNIASRIESFAIAGSVLISGAVFDEIKNQKDIQTVSLGKYFLKSVREPVEIYAISNPGLDIPEKNKLEGKGIPVSTKKKGVQKFVLFVAVISIVVLLAFFYRNIFLNPSKSATGKPKTIAVLPFTNLSASKEDEYFADGMNDEILTQVSKIGGLNVISRTSMLQFKGTKKTMKKIAEETGADVLLEGSVQKSNEKVRINVQLIDSKNDHHLWAETYDRDIKDIFAIQTDIAKQIAAALNTTLTEKEKSLFNEIPTANVLAYDFYLKGNKYAQSFWDYNKVNEVPQAVRMYEEAIRLDNKFTSPYAALIELYAGISWNKPLLNSDDYGVKARSWFDKMTALNIDDAHTHNATAMYRYKGERNYESALIELDSVDRILGNGKSTYMPRADIFRRLGRIDEALVYIKKQADLFPRQTRLWSELSETYKLKRDFDSAIYFIDKAIEIGPDLAGLYVNKAMYYAELKGDVDSAGSVLERASSLVDTNEFKPDFVYFEILKGNYDHALQLSAKNMDSLGILWQFKIVPRDLIIALMYHVQGKQEKAKSYFQKTYDLTYPLLNQYPDDFRMHAVVGIALAGLDEKERALREGAKACDLMPVSKDAILGTSPLESLALIYTLTGEHDKAVDILQQLLKMPFAWTMSNTIPLYRMHYYWKLLQTNRRFQQMIQ